MRDKALEFYFRALFYYGKYQIHNYSNSSIYLFLFYNKPLKNVVSDCFLHP